MQNMPPREREQKLNDRFDGGYLSVAEAARLLHFCTSKVYQLIKRGELKGERIGGSWRISLKALEKFVGK